MDVNHYIAFVAEAIAKVPKGYPLINKIYRKNKYEFYRAASESNLYDSVIINDGSIFHVEYARKILGILLFINQHEEDNEHYTQDVCKLVKESYPYVWQYAESRDEICFADFLKKLVKKKNGLRNIGDDELNCSLVILLFLSESSDKTIVKDEIYDTLINNYMHNRLRHSVGWKNINDSHNNLPLLDKQTKQIISAYLSEYNAMDFNKPYHELVGKNPVYNQFEFLFDYIPISSVSLVESTKYDPDIIEKVVKSYICHKYPFGIEDISKIDKKELYIHVMHGSLVYKLAQAYNEAKMHYFKNNQETMFFEFEQIKRERDVAVQKNIETVNLYKQLEAANNENERIIRRMMLENKTLKENQTDLVGLRELAFSLKSEDEFVAIPEAESLNKLRDMDVVVVGGLESWQRKLREYLPKGIFISIGAENFDVRLLHNNHYVFLNTRALTHKLYYRVVESLNENNVLRYFSRNNIESCLGELLSVLIT